ncbi:MAG: 50S ribosomal protein L30 [Haliscomenobacter sp.]|jgi:large subunit ribosomal protein L30|nr:50S ribosomal protein L30 [Haliscomenobacter sp.]
MAKVKITQVRSIIDRPKRQKDTIKALGLRRISHSVVKEVTPQIKGMIAKVNHLIRVEEVAE